MLGVRFWALKMSPASSICHNLNYYQIWPLITIVPNAELDWAGSDPKVRENTRQQPEANPFHPSAKADPAVSGATASKRHSQAVHMHNAPQHTIQSWVFTSKEDDVDCAANSAGARWHQRSTGRSQDGSAGRSRTWGIESLHAVFAALPLSFSDTAAPFLLLSFFCGFLEADTSTFHELSPGYRRHHLRHEVSKLTICWDPTHYHHLVFH